MRLAVAGLLGALALPTTVSAEVLAADDFESYSAGAMVSGLNRGTGWSGAWRGISGATISEEEVSRDGIGGGLSLKIVAANDNAFGRDVFSLMSTAGADYYVSFVFRVVGGTDGTAVSGNVFVGWQAEDDNPSISVDSIGVLGSGGRAGARVDNKTTLFDAPLVYGQTYQFIIKYTGWTGERYARTQVWLNPRWEDENSEDPTITIKHTEPETGGSRGFKGFRVRSFGLSASTYYLFDEIRVATEWSDLLTAPFVATAGPDWIPHQHSLEIAAGGVFDYSSQLDAPAGRHGRLVTTPDGHFEFADRPGVRVRFWGVNLTYSANYLSVSAADSLAERLARSGYNVVRLHHYDEYLVPTNADSWKLDTAKLEQLDYLVYALKRRGIYINIDLFSSRRFSSDEAKAFGVSSASAARNNFKALVPLVPAAMESWKKFATNLLNHRNRFTEQTWGEDPVFVGICPINENPLHRQLTDAGIAARYNALFDESRTPPPGETAEQRTAAYARFIFEKNAEADAEMFAHLRALGVRTLLTGANYTIAQGLTYVRQHYDYVDCHQYWDHPGFPVTSWALPFSFAQTSAITNRAFMPARLMAARVIGKPFVLTEVRFCRPNQFRAEGAVIMPAYASMQDWDALFTFHYSTDAGTVLSGGVDNYFALANDPIGLIGDRIGALLFLRGDVAPARGMVAFAARENEALTSLSREYPDALRPIGLVTRTGSLPGDPSDVLQARPEIDATVVGTSPTLSPLPARTYSAASTLATALMSAGVIPEDSISVNGRRLTSETGEIEIDADRQTMKVATERSELFVLAAGESLTGRRVTVNNGDAFGAVAVVALTTAAESSPSLGQTSRILIAHLTDSLSTGMRFTTPARQILEGWGRLPHLVRRGSATVRLRLRAGEWRAWTVDATGARVEAHVLSALGDDYWSLTLDTVGPAGARLAYELEWVLPRSAWEEWLATHFGVSVPPDSAPPEADPDCDGVSNLLEYAVGGDPWKMDTEKLPTVNAVASGRLTLTFNRIADSQLLYEVQGAEDITAASWSTIWTCTGETNQAGPVTVEDTVTLHEAPRRFLRLKVGLQLP